jgi:preprotein translocase subunit SecG
LIVLLQSGKGAEMGVSLGGGAGQTLFGAGGPATILTKITTGVAILFMVTSLTLAYMSGHKSDSSVMTENTIPVEQTGK